MNDLQCKFIAAFYSFSTYLTRSHVDSSSALFGVVLRIPIHNTSIYFTKLYSLRCLLIGFGTFVEYILSTLTKGVGKSGNNRLYLSVSSMFLMFTIRIILFIALYLSPHLAYHIYIILAVEALIFGTCLSITAIVPQHSVAVVLGSNACRLFIPSMQFILDLFFNKNPYLTIKIQCFISIVMTLITLISWILFITGTCTSSKTKSNSDSQKSKNNEIAPFHDTLFKAISPFLMFPAGSIFKDFLYPGVLPYAVLPRDKCHTINMLGVIFYGLGSLVLFILENTKNFKHWHSGYNWFWILSIPICFVALFTFLAIHTRLPSARRIINSKPIVLVMTLSVIIYYGFLYSLSLAGVPKVVDTGFGDGKKGDTSVITFNLVLSFFYRFLFSKLSVGYNDTRVKLGYHLPKFRPTHRMSKSNLAWYFFRQTFKRSWRDMKSDLKLDIQKYL